MTEQTYYVAKDGQTLGPYSPATILQYLREGRLAQTDHLLEPSRQEWIQLDPSLFEVANTPPTPPPVGPVINGVPSDYSKVPTTQRYGFVSIFVAIAALLWFIGLSVLALPFIGFVIFLLFRAPVYFKKKKPDGTLKTVGRGTKIAVIVFAVFVLIGFIATLAQVVSGSSASADPGVNSTSSLAHEGFLDLQPEQPRRSALPLIRAGSNAQPASGNQAFDKFAEGATVVTGQLPISFKQGVEYAIGGLLLVQNLADCWLTELLPDMMFQAFPRNTVSAMEFSMILQQYAEMDIYQPGTQRVIAVPANQEVFAGINLPDDRTIMAVRGRFATFHSIELTTGESARYPVFVVDKVQLLNGEVLDFSKQEGISDS